jgi:hypothetical protein
LDKRRICLTAEPLLNQQPNERRTCPPLPIFSFSILLDFQPEAEPLLCCPTYLGQQHAKWEKDSSTATLFFIPAKLSLESTAEPFLAQ